MMDWKDIAGALVRAGAPVIGGALGGPLGGMIGSSLGGVIAAALGTEPTPQAVDIALRTQAPEAIASKLQAAEGEAVARWPALAEIARAEAADRSEQSRAINETIRAELATQRWYSWRNLWGYSVMAECAAVSALVITDLATGDLRGVKVFLDASAFFLSWYGMRIGVLGYVLNRNSAEKTAVLTGEAPGLVAQVAKAVVKRR
jgi:hypothetical protein